VTRVCVWRWGGAALVVGFQSGVEIDGNSNIFLIGMWDAFD